MIKTELQKQYCNYPSFIFAKSNTSLPSLPTIHTIGQHFIELNEVDSTNTYAIELIKANLAAHGTVVFAHHQFAGRGQYGRKWDAQPGENITCSVVVDIQWLPVFKHFFLSAATALAVHDLVSNYLGAQTKIKWPNDIYWNDSKAGGILIETVYNQQQAKFAVVGIGLNINQENFPEQLTKAVSFYQVNGVKYDLLVLTKALCSYLNTRYEALLQLQLKELLTAYNEHLFKRDEWVKLKKGNTSFNCIVLKVNELGELQVANALQTSFAFGEVEWVLGNKANS